MYIKVFINPNTAETHGCVLSTAIAEVLKLEHEASSITSADQISIALDLLQKRISH